MIGDRHVHSRFSFDSSQSEIEIIENAIALGMKEICFTDHCDFDLGPDWINPIEEYTKTLEKLKKEYADRIDVHIGIEMGLNPKFNKEINDFLASYPFEYVIGSVHTMLGDDPYYRNKYHMDDSEFYRNYFETALYCVQNSEGFDSFGHFDYVVRYGEFKAESYDPSENAQVIDEILKEIISRNIALELNTGGLRRGIDFVHPHDYIISRYRELGGRLITVGSDAHLGSHIGSGFDAAEEVMARFGLTENDLLSYRNA